MFKKFEIAAVALLMAAAPAAAQNSTASTSTTGSTTIAAPISLTQNSALAFGSLVRPTSGTNSVTLGTTTCTPALGNTGNAALISSTSGCATYSVTGESGQAFNIVTDPTFDMTHGSDTITVTLAKSAATGTIGQASAAFKVGGSFNVTSATPAGAYSGTFNVTVTYQ